MVNIQQNYGVRMKRFEEILSKFAVPGKFVDAKPYGSGHINDTILVRFNQSGKYVKYILRKINSYVFKEPKRIIENTVNVTNHIRQKLIENVEEDLDKKVLTLIKAVDGNYFYADNNEYWCLLYFIEDAYTVDHVENREQAYEAAKAYGKFQKYLADYDTSKCYITIIDFHHLSNRIIAFENAIKSDPKNRVGEVIEEIKLAESFLYLNEEFKQLQNKNLPIRITHNDTKINNIMLHQVTKEGICVIDLDTVMPGIILNDFGDMVRTFTSPALEDEQDYTKVTMRLSIFESLVKGYLFELNNYLTEDEVKNLVLGAKIIVYEQAIRFLTDYLIGDAYYKVDYDSHNLNRAKNQFALLSSIEEQSVEMEKIINKYSLISSETFEN